MESIANIRKDYKLQSLDEHDVAATPIGQFTAWWSDAVNSNIDEINAMTLATATPAGKPDARIVLLKGFDDKGFVFFTNYESRKGQELAANPFATLVFFWKELERQVRIEGSVEKINEQDSDAYFHSRPVGSRIGAWASPQSTIISNRNLLEENVKELEIKYTGSLIPRPEHWGGYIVLPTQVEYWQGRSSRLHDRIRYRMENGAWVIERLAP
ncbi:MAG: pyridoxamine 5'-phosphate oxidase [Bacteroidota bacterium]